jgi:hypothetical protein
MSTRLAIGAVVVALLAGGALLRDKARATARSRERAREPAVELRVPHRVGAIAIDGELEDSAWRTARSTRAFVDPNGEPARPHSEARFLWDENDLYVLLYAADEDIQATHTGPDDAVWEDDAFHLLFDNGEDEIAIDLSARGVVADAKRKVGTTNADGARPFDYAWTSGARVATDVDGTYGDPSDDDEEWVLEVVIPLASLGVTGAAGARLAVTARRCDTPKSGARTCGAFPGRGKGGLLVFAEEEP